MTKVARDVMQPDPLSVPQDMAYLPLLHLFVEAEISSAPVVDAGGLVVGIVSIKDLMRAVDQAFDEDVDAGELQGNHELGESLRSLTARDVASRDVLWVDESTPIAEVAGAMRRRGAHRALVGGGGKAAGVLTTFDLLAEVEATRSAR